MKNIFNLLSVCIIMLSVLIVKAQNTDATYYQIANMGKQLYEITEKDNHIQYQKISYSAGERVCLLAYDHNSNNLLALTMQHNLLTFDRTGRIISKRKLAIDSKSIFVTSTTDLKGNLYVGNSSMSEVYKINIESLDIEKISTGKRKHIKKANYLIHDLAYVDKYKSFLSINNEGELVSFKTRNLNSRTVAKLDLPKGVFGSVWYDGENKMFAHHNVSSKIYSIDLRTKEVKLLDVAPFFGHWNDGTACFNIQKVESESVNSNPLQSSVQIRHAQNLSDITLSPNPNKGLFKVQLDKECSKNVLIRVLDINGKLIYQDAFVNNATIDLRKKYSAAGTFIVQIVEGDVVIDTKKFIMN